MNADTNIRRIQYTEVYKTIRRKITEDMTNYCEIQLKIDAVIRKSK